MYLFYFIVNYYYYVVNYRLIEISLFNPRALAPWTIEKYKNLKIRHFYG